MIFAIDPGSDKTGVAVINEDGTLVMKDIIETAGFTAYLDRIYGQYPFEHIVMGNGTNHMHLQPLAEAWIQKQSKAIGFSLIDEQFTTVEGRKLYWQYTPRHGWRRLMPLAFQYPPEPVDDFVAWIIGRRYLEKQGDQ